MDGLSMMEVLELWEEIDQTKRHLRELDYKLNSKIRGACADVCEVLQILREYTGDDDMIDPYISKEYVLHGATEINLLSNRIIWIRCKELEGGRTIESHEVSFPLEYLFSRSWEQEIRSKHDQKRRAEILQDLQDRERLEREEYARLKAKYGTCDSV